MYVYIYIYIYIVCVYIYIYTYIYKERERERGKQRDPSPKDSSLVRKETSTRKGFLFCACSIVFLIKELLLGSGSLGLLRTLRTRRPWGTSLSGSTAAPHAPFCCVVCLCLMVCIIHSFKVYCGWLCLCCLISFYRHPRASGAAEVVVCKHVMNIWCITSY